jgi:exodeoxyribonuclease VII small subunit
MTKKTSASITKEISKMTFEQAMLRLEEIVEKMSSDKIALDSMVDFYEEAKLLKEHCAKQIDQAKMKIEIISKE